MSITDWIYTILLYGSVQINSLDKANEIVEAAKEKGYNFAIMNGKDWYVIVR